MGSNRKTLSIQLALVVLSRHYRVSTPLDNPFNKPVMVDNAGSMALFTEHTRLWGEAYTDTLPLKGCMSRDSSSSEAYLISLIRFSADLIAKAEIRLKYAIFSRQAGDQLRHGLMKAEYLILFPYRCC